MSGGGLGQGSGYGNSMMGGGYQPSQPYGQPQGYGQPSYGGYGGMNQGGGQYSPMTQMGGYGGIGNQYATSNPNQVTRHPRGTNVMRDVSGGMAPPMGGPTLSGSPGYQNGVPLRSTQAAPMMSSQSPMLSSTMGQQNVAPMRNAPQPAQQAYQNANANAAFQPGAVAGYGNAGQSANGMRSAMGAEPAPSAPSAMGVQPKAYNDPIPGPNPGLTIDPRSMGFIQAWGGYGDHAGQANQYNQDYWQRFPTGQAPGGPMNYTPRNWDFNNGIG